MKIIEIQSAFPDMDSASAAIQELLSMKLIACGNIVSTQSIYMWQEKLHKESESLALIKTSKELKDLVIQKINTIHPYDVPAVLSWEVEANESYATWVNEMTKQNS